MKIITIDIKSRYKRFSLLLKIIAFSLLVLIPSEIASQLYVKSARYEEALSKLTEEKLVIIDAGHGGEDCGAIGKNGVYEKDLNLEIAFLLGQRLSEMGYAVIYTRTNDALLYRESENIKGIRKISDLKNRCKFGAENPNAIFVSIHMNTFGDSAYSGLQVYYSVKNEESRLLAENIQDNVKTRLQQKNNRKTKLGKSMYLMENLENAAVLIECGFLSNTEECKKLCEKEYQKELSFAIVCGIIEYKNESISKNNGK